MNFLKHMVGELLFTPQKLLSTPSLNLKKYPIYPLKKTILPLSITLHTPSLKLPTLPPLPPLPSASLLRRSPPPSLVVRLPPSSEVPLLSVAHRPPPPSLAESFSPPLYRPQSLCSAQQGRIRSFCSAKQIVLCLVPTSVQPNGVEQGLSVRRVTKRRRKTSGEGGRWTAKKGGRVEAEVDGGRQTAREEGRGSEGGRQMAMKGEPSLPAGGREGKLADIAPLPANAGEGEGKRGSRVGHQAVPPMGQHGPAQTEQCLAWPGIATVSGHAGTAH